MSLFEYSVTRPIRLGRWGVVLFGLVALIYIAVITILNVISVGYENVEILSSSYNATQTLWYQHLPYGNRAPPSVTCNPTQLSWNQVVQVMPSNDNLFTYQLEWNATDGQAYGAQLGSLNYEGGELNCSDLSFEMGFSGSNFSVDFITLCYTPMNPALQLGYTVDPTMWGVPPNFFLGPNAAQQIPESWDSQSNSNVTKIVYLYAGILIDIWQMYPPFGAMTQFPIYLHYDAQYPGSILVIISNATVGTPQYITFNLDTPRGASAFPGFNSLFGQPDDFPLADYFAWMFVVWNSLTLFDLGLLVDRGANIQQNIFNNQTLYENYNSFLSDVLLPYLDFTFPIANFNPVPLSETNQLQERPASLQTTYLCSQRQLKGWLSVFIAVLAADAALIISAYNLFIFVAGYLQKRRDKLQAQRLQRDGNGDGDERVPLTSDPSNIELKDFSKIKHGERRGEETSRSAQEARN